MNIYIEKELKEMKQALANKGYNIVNDNSTPCDAIICNLKACDLAAINQEVNLKREGALIIDSGSKSVEDIDYILNNRSYSNIL
ncbi:MAG: hypothetical protein GX206_04715 [Clostridiales bacterium]|nr:hypothetical protein [Clostridiales bacterium]